MILLLLSAEREHTDYHSNYIHLCNAVDNNALLHFYTVFYTVTVKQCVYTVCF